MDAYCEEVRKLEKNFYGLEFHHVIHDNNVAVDVLAMLGSSRTAVPAEVFVQDLTKPSIKTPDDPSTSSNPDPDRQVLVINPDWTLPLIDYILHKKVPGDKAEAERVIRCSKNYVVIGDKLFRRGALSRVLMRCISSKEGKELLEEIHSGICGNHAASCSIVGRAFRSGFYWPTAVADAEDIVRRCQGYQYFARQPHVPASELNTIPLSWPFACWGLDMVGPLKKAPGGFEWLLVAIDKFTKWIEVMPVFHRSSG